MTFDYTLTFGSSAVQLSTVVVPGQNTTSAKFVSLQPDSANSGVIYVGGNNHGASVSSSSYGFRLEIPVSTVPPAPFIIELAPQTIDLSQFWVKGTSSDKLHIFMLL